MFEPNIYVHMEVFFTVDDLFTIFLTSVLFFLCWHNYNAKLALMQQHDIFITISCVYILRVLFSV